MKCGILHRKKRKLWVWLAINRYTQEPLAISTGSRGKKTFKSIMATISSYSTTHYATDSWKIYSSLPREKHLVGKRHTTQIESLNANIRHYLSRFRRRTRCYSKSPDMVLLSLYLLLYKDRILDAIDLF